MARCALICLLAGSALAGSLFTPGPGEVLIFEDTFTNPKLNLSLWKHEITLAGGGNWEFTAYLNNRSVSFVEDGSLNIFPVLSANVFGNLNAPLDVNLWGGDPASACTDNGFYGCERSTQGGDIVNPVISARVRTAETFAFTYGRVEVVAKLPKGDWFWPAIWLLPENEMYGTWPGSGEIDIMESRGNDASYPAGGVNKFGSTLHWGPFWPLDGYPQTTASYTSPNGTDLSQAFHTYGFYWNETYMGTYIDETPVLEVNLAGTSFWEMGGFGANPNVANPWSIGGGGPNAPFDERFYLIINMAVGGTNGYFPDSMGGKPWSDESQTASSDFWNGQSQWLPTWPLHGPNNTNVGNGLPFMIDSVRVWQEAPNGDYAYRLML